MTENEAIKDIQFLARRYDDLQEVNMSVSQESLDMAIQALEIVAKMKEHCEGSCTDCPYWNPKFDKCMNDLLKGE